MGEVNIWSEYHQAQREGGLIQIWQRSRNDRLAAIGMLPLVAAFDLVVFLAGAEIALLTFVGVGVAGLLVGMPIILWREVHHPHD
jgi:hypothetical protein